MQEIPTGPLERDLAQFLKLLDAVQEEAREDGHWKLVSVSLAATHIDPLAVLESIYEPGERHAYIEHPQSGEALAGAEAVFKAELEGADRFSQAREWLDELFEHTVSVGQLDLPGSGPRVFCGFTFEDNAGPEAPFAPATLFVPRWQVSVCDGAYTATANLRVDPTGPMEPQARRILAAHDRFSRFEYGAEPVGDWGCLDPQQFRIAEGAPGSGSYAARVLRALERIRAGACEKIVVARRVTYETGGTDAPPVRPLQVLNRLRERFPSCRTYSFANQRGQSLIGATPERLVRLRDAELKTEAIAGSAPRSESTGQDAALAADLLGSDKDRREHDAVADFIVSRLQGLAFDVQKPSRPRLLRLPNVQHLVTPFTVQVPEGTHVLEVADALFPTPAVAGLPQERARLEIAQLEDGPRGLYAGLVGWVDAQGEGELSVALRCGLVDGHRITLHAGAGIVEGSDPQREASETLTKMQAMQGAMLG